MAIKLHQGLRQSQNMMITPQLQQAIKLLTLTHLEMTNLISQEMVENPLLEEVENTDKNEMPESNLEYDTKEATAENFSGPELIEGSKESFDWESYVDSYNNNNTTTPREKYNSEEAPNYENMVSKGQNLHEHLIWQLRMEDLADDEYQFCHEIVHNINDDGYLELSFDEILSKFDISRPRAIYLHEKVQNLDPVGCAASDLSECLMIQARCLSERSPLAELIIIKHLTDLQKKDYTKISKTLGVSRDKVKDAELIIMNLHPKPGRLISPEETQYVVPDIFVAEVGGEYAVQLNDDGVPKLRISQLYQSLIKNKNPENSETKEFVSDKLRSALWLIKSIENRQKTIYKVAAAIVRNQQDFFKKGTSQLKPMILKDIANEIGMHESTVSRVTTNKFMHSPIGTFELKFFFNSGIGGKNGGVDIASESLKLKIKELIDNEDNKRPLSDQKISEILSTKDIIVARRTVAKYREMLEIAPSSKRKEK